jgi:ornithine cyclodeaminase/alanine dehydrogenase-like protein (mu-crystallin family)
LRIETIGGCTAIDAFAALSAVEAILLLTVRPEHFLRFIATALERLRKFFEGSVHEAVEEVSDLLRTATSENEPLVWGQGLF